MNDSTDNIQLEFIPQLQLYYDPVRKIYLTPEGTVANGPTSHRHQNAEDPLNNIKFDPGTTTKIVGFAAALVMQYAVLVNKIDDNTEKLKTANTTIEQTEKELKELETKFNKLESQLTITTELINQIQIHMSNDRKK